MGKKSKDRNQPQRSLTDEIRKAHGLLRKGEERRSDLFDSNANNVFNRQIPETKKPTPLQISNAIRRNSQ